MYFYLCYGININKDHRDCLVDVLYLTSYGTFLVIRLGNDSKRYMI